MGGEAALFSGCCLKQLRKGEEKLLVFLVCSGSALGAELPRSSAWNLLEGTCWWGQLSTLSWDSLSRLQVRQRCRHRLWRWRDGASLGSCSCRGSVLCFAPSLHGDRVTRAGVPLAGLFGRRGGEFHGKSRLWQCWPCLVPGNTVFPFL